MEFTYGTEAMKKIKRKLLKNFGSDQQLFEVKKLMYLIRVLDTAQQSYRELQIYKSCKSEKTKEEFRSQVYQIWNQVHQQNRFIKQLQKINDFEKKSKLSNKQEIQKQTIQNEISNYILLLNRSSEQLKYENFQFNFQNKQLQTQLLEMVETNKKYANLIKAIKRYRKNQNKNLLQILGEDCKIFCAQQINLLQNFSQQVQKQKKILKFFNKKKETVQELNQFQKCLNKLYQIQNSEVNTAETKMKIQQLNKRIGSINNYSVFQRFWNNVKQMKKMCETLYELRDEIYRKQASYDKVKNLIASDIILQTSLKNALYAITKQIVEYKKMKSRLDKIGLISTKSINNFIEYYDNGVSLLKKIALELKLQTLWEQLKNNKQIVQIKQAQYSEPQYQFELFEYFQKILKHMINEGKLTVQYKLNKMDEPDGVNYDKRQSQDFKSKKKINQIKSNDLRLAQQNNYKQIISIKNQRAYELKQALQRKEEENLVLKRRICELLKHTSNGKQKLEQKQQQNQNKEGHELCENQNELNIYLAQSDQNKFTQTNHSPSNQNTYSYKRQEAQKINSIHSHGQSQRQKSRSQQSPQKVQIIEQNISNIIEKNNILEENIQNGVNKKLQDIRQSIRMSIYNSTNGNQQYDFNKIPGQQVEALCASKIRQLLLSQQKLHIKIQQKEQQLFIMKQEKQLYQNKCKSFEAQIQQSSQNNIILQQQIILLENIIKQLKNDIKSQIQKQDQECQTLTNVEVNIQEKGINTQSEINQIDSKDNLVQVKETQTYNVQQISPISSLPLCLNQYKQTLLFYGTIFNEQSCQKYSKFKRIFIKKIQNLMSRPIKSTIKLYQLDKKNPTTPLQYIQGQDNWLALFKLSNGQIVGGFSQLELGIQQNKDQIGYKGLLFNVTKQKYYYLQVKQQKSRIYQYEQYYLIIGNSQIRYSFKDNIIQSNFGGTFRYFNTGKDTNETYFGTNDSEIRVEMFEAYRIVFE